MFDIVHNSSKLLLEIMTLLSSANCKVHTVGGRSFMCIMKSKGPRIDLLQGKLDLHFQI
jgi:hypothetical protein